MEKTTYEQMGSPNTQQDDDLLPDVRLPKQENYEIGVWSNRRRQLLKEYHRVKYYNKLLSSVSFSLVACYLQNH